MVGTYRRTPMTLEQTLTLIGSQGLAVGLVVWAVWRGLPMVLARVDAAFARIHDGQCDTTEAIRANTSKLGELHLELVRNNRINGHGPRAEDAPAAQVQGSRFKVQGPRR
jgi:hypothetical protein